MTSSCEVSKCAKKRNRYNQVPHLTQDTNGKVINLQLDKTNERQEVSPFPADDHKAHINRRDVTSKCIHGRLGGFFSENENGQFQEQENNHYL